jgi:hypothetical protein
VRAGAGALPLLPALADGDVLGWGPRAGYVVARGELVVLTSPGVMPGPIHVELAAPLPPTPPRPTAVAAEGIAAWRGALPEPARIREGLPLLAAVVRAASRRSALRDHAGRGQWAALLAQGAWTALAARLGGLGPGLTPAGDDFIAGAAFVARACLGRAAEDRLLAAVAATSTNAISLGYLRWAARGQALAPAHYILAAAACGDEASAHAAALTLGRVGHSSGADLCLGMAEAASALLSDAVVTA